MLKTTKICSLPALEAGPQKSGCEQGLAPSKGSGKSLPGLTQLLGAPCFRGVWQHHSSLSLCLRMTSSSVSMSIPPSLLLSRLVITCRVHPNPGPSRLEILNLLEPVNTPKTFSHSKEVLDRYIFWDIVNYAACSRWHYQMTAAWPDTGQTRDLDSTFPSSSPMASKVCSVVEMFGRNDIDLGESMSSPGSIPQVGNESLERREEK